MQVVAIMRMERLRVLGAVLNCPCMHSHAEGTLQEQAGYRPKHLSSRKEGEEQKTQGKTCHRNQIDPTESHEFVHGHVPHACMTCRCSAMEPMLIAAVCATTKFVTSMHG